MLITSTDLDCGDALIPLALPLNLKQKHKHTVHAGDILLQHFRTKPARPQVHLGKKELGQRTL